MLIKCCKKNDGLSAQPCCAGLDRSPFVLTEHISSFIFFSVVIHSKIDILAASKGITLFEYTH